MQNLLLTSAAHFILDCFLHAQLHPFHCFQHFANSLTELFRITLHTHLYKYGQHTSTRIHTHVPFHPTSVDIIPPALTGFTPAIGSPLALKVPTAVRAFTRTEVTSDGHQHLAMGTLEVKALAPGIYPLFTCVIRVAMLSIVSGEKHQQGQSQQNMSWVHPEVKHCGTFQWFLCPQGSLRCAGQMFYVWIQGLNTRLIFLMLLRSM